MKTPNLKTILTLALLFCLSAQTMLAEDYTDKINNEAVSTKGQRVVYELNVGSFTTEGTFAAAQERLAELKALGIDVVWLMPIYPRGGGINSPYAATNFQKVNSSYGTIADLKAFVARAHELKMEVWLDWVPNHTATNADWVKSHPEYYKKNGSSFVPAQLQQHSTENSHDRLPEVLDRPGRHRLIPLRLHIESLHTMDLLGRCHSRNKGLQGRQDHHFPWRSRHRSGLQAHSAICRFRL